MPISLIFWGIVFFGMSWRAQSAGEGTSFTGTEAQRLHHRRCIWQRVDLSSSAFSYLSSRRGHE